MFRAGADGLAAQEPTRVASRSGLHGIAFSKGKVYLATVHDIFKTDVRPNGTFGPLNMIIHDLPDAGQHKTRTVQIGPDDMMYISIGPTCNECNEPNPENATLLRASLDGKSRSNFASGLRDTVGWGWQAAPMQMSFDNASQFPAEYQGAAFISMRGSWNRKPPSGYEVVRIHFKNGQPVSMEPFVTGFVTPQGEYGRLVGNAVAQDGSLLFQMTAMA